jgi:hypothetical protein
MPMPRVSNEQAAHVDFAAACSLRMLLLLH